MFVFEINHVLALFERLKAVKMRLDMLIFNFKRSIWEVAALPCLFHAFFEAGSRMKNLRGQSIG